MLQNFLISCWNFYFRLVLQFAPSKFSNTKFMYIFFPASVNQRSMLWFLVVTLVSSPLNGGHFTLSTQLIKPNYIGNKPYYGEKEDARVETSTEEIKKLIALILYCGLINVSSFQRYWSTKTLYHGLWAQSIIPRLIQGTYGNASCCQSRWRRWGRQIEKRG